MRVVKAVIGVTVISRVAVVTTAAAVGCTGGMAVVAIPAAQCTTKASKTAAAAAFITTSLPYGFNNGVTAS